MTTYNLVLNLWKSGYSASMISDDLNISERTVFYHLSRGRMALDPRASARVEPPQARHKRVRIRLLYQAGAEAAHIAKLVGCTRRLVNYRKMELRG